MASCKRINQVLRFGWEHAGVISKKHFAGKKRVCVFFDILLCFIKYGMWSNQYLKENIWALSSSEKEIVGQRIQLANKKREQWLKDFYKNRDFTIKYGDIKYERSFLREKRNRVYSERYNVGKNLLVEYDVEISRQHYLDGTISIGNNVLLAKHVFIDYSGDVVIEDDVKISSSAVIESHRHVYVPGANKHEAVPSKITIEKGVWIGHNALICESTKRIGRFAQIGAGAVRLFHHMRLLLVIRLK